MLIKYLLAENPFNNKLALVRSLLATSTLLTLLFTDAKLLFSAPFVNQGCISGIGEYSIFCIFWDNLYVAKYIAITILMLVIIGFLPCLTGVLHWWISISFFTSSPYIDGGDQIISILTFLLIPVTLSDTRMNHWKLIPMNSISKLIANFSFIVIRIQISVVYLHAAVSKLSIQEWLNGTVIYYWFTHNNFGVNDAILPAILPLLENNWSVFLITWAVLVLELMLFAAILAPIKIKRVLLPLGVTFHFFTFIIHGLGTFFLAMTAALILYLSKMANPIAISRMHFNFGLKKLSHYH